MRRLIKAVALTVLALEPLQAEELATIETFGGAWETSWGEVWVTQTEFGYQGTYTEDNGFFGLEFDGHVFAGHWLEDKSNKPCDIPFEGSYHWGRLELSNSNTYPGIEMIWGFCNERIDKKWAFYERLPDGL